MPLYFGFPVTCQEAFRLFSLNFEEAKGDIMQQYSLTENMHMDCHFLDYVNQFFKMKGLDMRAFYTDKGQCIIGYEAESLSVFEKNLVTCKHFMYSLQHFESHFWYEVKRINCDKNFDKIVLEHMEGDPETITHDHRLYLLEYNR
jgi:hypothetical protein